MERKAESLPRNRHTSRASFACARCKKAKRRCDIAQQIGQGKACSACRQRSETCDSRQHGEDKRRRRERHNTAELRMRIASLENEIRAISAHSGSKGIEDRQPSQSTLQLASTPEQQDQQRVDSPARQLAHPSPAISKRIPSATPVSPFDFHATNAGNRSLASPKSSTCPPDDGLKATSQDLKWFPTGMDEVTPPSSILRGNEGKNQRYFGATSMFPYGERHSPPPRHTVADYLAQRAQLSPTALEDFSEPEPIVTHLLDLFWTYQASHLLVVDRQTFMRHRNMAREGDSVGDRNFYTPCLLYSILALASMISTDKGVRRYSAGSGDSPGDSYNQRARILFDIEIETPTVSTVQAAILIGARYGTFVDNCLGWTFSGMAFRMATKLGLHLDCSKIVKMGHMSEETARCRAVTFWGCYIEDKLYSAYCQRPTMLMDWDITIAPPEDYPDAKPYMSSYLLPWTVSLNRLCGKILLGLYAQRHYNSGDDGLKKIASEIHRQLWEWQHTIPAELSWPATGDMDRAPPSVLVLHMQFYYNLILFHRPFLEFSRIRHELSQSLNGSTTSTSTCTVSAVNITRLIREYRENYNMRQISPNAVHITFIAATIHLINFRLTNVESHGQLLRDCLPALSELGDSYPMASKALNILSTLIERFDPLDDSQGEQCEEGEESRGGSPQNTNTSKQHEQENWPVTSNNPNPNSSNTQQSAFPPCFWSHDAEPHYSHNWNEPLEVPPLIDLEHLPNMNAELRNQNSGGTGIDSTYNNPSSLLVDSQRYYEEPMSWLNNGCFSMMGLESSGFDLDERSLFDAFYGKPNGLN